MSVRARPAAPLMNVYEHKKIKTEIYFVNCKAWSLTVFFFKEKIFFFKKKNREGPRFAIYFLFPMPKESEGTLRDHTS